MITPVNKAPGSANWIGKAEAAACGSSVPVIAPPTATAAPTPASRASGKRPIRLEGCSLSRKSRASSHEKPNSVIWPGSTVCEPIASTGMKSCGMITFCTATTTAYPAATPTNRYMASRKSGLSPSM